jgi:hypothetical protein
MLQVLNARAANAAVFRGENISEKAKGIHREELLRIMRHFMAQGDAMSMERRAIMLLLYHSIGRAGEAAATNFNLLYWDDTHFLLWSGWNQMKASRGGELSYTCDSSNFELDLIHALATYVLSAGHKLSKRDLTRGPNGDVVPDLVWLFPDYAKLEGGGCAAKINNVLRQLYEAKVTSMLFTSHGLRVGATNDLAMQSDVPFLSIVARGDWFIEGECTVYHYISRERLVTNAGTFYIVLIDRINIFSHTCFDIVAKGLAGWKDKTAKIYPPTLASLPESGKLRMFVKELFACAPEELHAPKLKGLLDTMAAQLIMTFVDMKTNYNKCNQNCVVKKIVAAMELSELSHETLYKWGIAIKRDYVAKNVLARCDNSAAALKAEVASLSTST